MPVPDFSLVEVVSMERDKLKHECPGPTQDLPRTLSTFWANQLERIKERAEHQVNRKSAPFKHNGHLRLDSGGANRN